MGRPRQANSPPIRSAPESPPEVAPKASILIVDDHPENLLALEATLSFLEEDIVKAHSGRDALKLLLDQDFAVILLDVHMPDMDGFETAAMIRSREKSQSIPIIFLTAMRKEAGQVFRGYSLGAVDYILKPFEPEILRAKVAVFIELHKKTEKIRVQAGMLQIKNHELDAINRAIVELNREIEKKNDELELRVEERTAELARTNAALQAEILERRRAEEERTQLLISEQNAREEAESANRAKDEFLATVSHELRTPLTAILGWTRLLRTRPDTASRERGLETIERNARSQARLIEDILDVSRIISGKLRIEPRQTELIPIIEMAVDAVRPAIDAKTQCVELLLDAAVGTLRGDPNRLQQVVWNLLSNATKFTPNGGRIIVELKRGEFTARLTVSDTGCGISAEFLPYVFDRFSQGERHMTGRHGGLGLGLAIVRHIVEMHGGTVRVHSPGEGQGTTFVVELPLLPGGIEEPALECESKEATQAIGRQWEGLGMLRDLKIVLVDDDPDTLQMLSVVLDEAGGEVKACTSTAEALATLDWWSADLVVSDLGMPNEDGYALIRKMRTLQSGRGATTPAIALTAFASAADRAKALEAGFEAHIAKPIEPLELVTVIAQLTGKTRPDGEEGVPVS